MSPRRAQSGSFPHAQPAPRTMAGRQNELKALRHRLAEAAAEIQFYKEKQRWLQTSLATQRHARQMLEASLSAGYTDTVACIRQAVKSVIPAGAKVVVISKGDPGLLALPGREAWHFPQTEDGEYAGYHPADSAAAISQLQSLILKGADYLVLPNTAFWWLEHYREFAEWLASAQTPAWRDERCAIYKLSRKGHRLTSRVSLASAKVQPRSNGVAIKAVESVSTVQNTKAQALVPRYARASLKRVAQGVTHRPSILCFPIIDWDFRFQRPQQLMKQFAAAGHKVFYLSHQFRKSGEPCVLRPLAPCLWEVSLRGPRFPAHQGLLDEAHTEALSESLASLWKDRPSEPVVALIQSPFWSPLVKPLAKDFGCPVVYDCMDHHAGFSNSNPLLVEQERELMGAADLVVVSSARLEMTVRRHNRKVLLIRNGCEYEHFARIKPKPRGIRPVIGYYGAISDWFDSDLVADLAERHPGWDFILVGSTLHADTRRLARLSNLALPGEQPYAEIPKWLAKFDVVILPFKRTPLTEAANPVKAYEVFASGKPLVSVPLPEMRPMVPLVRLASTAEEFAREIKRLLDRPKPGLETRRRRFARNNTWLKRFEQLVPAIRKTVALHQPSRATTLSTSSSGRRERRRNDHGGKNP